MAQVEIYVNQAKIDAEVAKAEATGISLQSIYDDLKTLGVSAPTLSDIRTLQSNNTHPDIIKSLVVRGKTLAIAGIQIDPSAIQLDGTLVSAVRQKVGQLTDVQSSYYELEDDEISVIGNLAAIIKPGYTLMGSELAAEIVADVTALCVNINAILDKFNPGVHSPMRSPDGWIVYNADTKRFSVDKFTIAGKIV